MGAWKARFVGPILNELGEKFVEETAAGFRMDARCWSLAEYHRVPRRKRRGVTVPSNSLHPHVSASGKMKVGRQTPSSDPYNSSRGNAFTAGRDTFLLRHYFVEHLLGPDLSLIPLKTLAQSLFLEAGRYFREIMAGMRKCK